MKTITIQILAEDIKTSQYINSDDCAMTRAFRRAGLPFKETGGDIDMDNSYRRIMKTPKKLSDKVKGMYKYVNSSMRIDDKIAVIPPEDFTFELELPDESY